MAKKSMVGSIQKRETQSIYNGDIELSQEELDIIDGAINPDDLGYAEITQTGISFVRDLTLEEWKALGLHIRKRVDGFQWAIGDFINAGKDEWGDFYSLASEITNYSYSSLRKFAMVSAGYELFRRRNNLSYSHHIEALVADNPQQWLELAEEEGWSVRQLRDEINPVKDLPEPVRVPIYTRWSEDDRAAQALSRFRKEKSKREKNNWKRFAQSEIERWQRVAEEMENE
jgi:hypothetical protein